MTEQPIEKHASCSCGELSVKTLGEPLRVSICHCLECQKRSGNVFSTQVRYERKNVTLSGTPATYTRTADSGHLIHFQFCSNCGGTITYYLDQEPDVLAIPAGMFSDQDLPQPLYSVYERRMHPWVSLPTKMEHVD